MGENDKILYDILKYLLENKGQSITHAYLTRDIFKNKYHQQKLETFVSNNTQYGYWSASPNFIITNIGKSKLIELEASFKKEIDQENRFYKELEFLQKQITDLDSKKSEFWKAFWYGAIASFISAFGVGYMLNKTQKEPQEKYIVLPKIQIVHDTVFVKK